MASRNISREILEPPTLRIRSIATYIVMGQHVDGWAVRQSWTGRQRETSLRVTSVLVRRETVSVGLAICCWYYDDSKRRDIRNVSTGQILKYREKRSVRSCTLALFREGTDAPQYQNRKVSWMRRQPTNNTIDCNVWWSELRAALRSHSLNHANVAVTDLHLSSYVSQRPRQNNCTV